MERLKKILGDSVFVIQILIVFLLVFENSIVLPPFLQAFGRLHPLLLHLPIGLFLVTVLLIFGRRYFDGTSFNNLLTFLLFFTAITASLTTMMGLLLSMEDVFAADQLFVHKWLGVALSFLCWILLSLRHQVRILKPGSAVVLVVLIFTGHYGANLTHGEDFVWAPLQSDEIRKTRVITDSSAVFTATIEPILESKCYSCHNTKKAKGDLILTSLQSIAAGGKNGDLWKAHDPANSLIVERLSLPLENKEHMPPKDKAQLTADEVQFITLWIAAGADTEKKLNELPETDTLKQLASVIIPRYVQPAEKKSVYSFEFASPEKIEKLTIPNRSVFQIAKNEPAIQADFFLRQTFEKRYLEELTDVRRQLIALNLANMPVEDADLKTIGKFENLEVLNLNNTKVKGNGLTDLVPLSNLRSLSLSGTEVSTDMLEAVARNKSLQEIFVWNTNVTQEEVATLNKRFPHIRWDFGYIPDEKEVLKLNVPILRNAGKVLPEDENVILKHNLPGTVVRYTIDGGDPDSLKSPAYTAPVAIEHASIIKTKAYKEGWLSSDIAEFVVFKKGYKPTDFRLTTKPDDRYPGEGEITLTDGEKGLPDFYRHPAWMAFRDNDLVANVTFDQETPVIRTVTISFAKNVNAMCMPPQEVQVWGGNDPDNLDLIAKVNPTQPAGYDPTRIEGVNVPLPSTRFRYYRLIARPLQKLPEFRKAKKGEKAWLMVDEIFFN